MSTSIDADGSSLITDTRSRLRQMIASGCERANRRHARAAVLVLALAEGHTEAAGEMRAVLDHWQRSCRDRVHCTELGGGRAGIVIAPVGFDSEADEIGEQLVRSLALPSGRATRVVWLGSSLFPDDGIDPDTLLERAERSLERRRRSAVLGGSARAANAAGVAASVPGG